MIFKLPIDEYITAFIESDNDNIAVCEEFKKLFLIMKPLYDKEYIEFNEDHEEIWITKTCGPVKVTFELNNDQQNGSVE